MLILANIAGFMVAKWRWFVIFVGIVLIFVMFGFILRAFRHTPKLNLPEIQRAQKAIANDDGEEMTKVLVESDVREKHIDENLANGNSVKVDAINESKKTWANASNEEKAAELERRAREGQ
jgi:flagellar biosynthesis/type III secretory pathway M-ring protein FliF/YscJ